jgi:hypothetical protein
VVKVVIESLIEVAQLCYLVTCSYSTGDQKRKEIFDYSRTLDK